VMLYPFGVVMVVVCFGVVVIVPRVGRVVMVMVQLHSSGKWCRRGADFTPWVGAEGSCQVPWAERGD